MRESLALMRVSLLGLFATFSGNRKTKKKVSVLLVVVLMLVISAYISGLYSYLMAASLAPAGMLDLLPVLISVLACILSLIFCAMGAGGVVFSGKDMDLMLSLPVSSFSVMLSKLLALYVENLMLNVFFLVPAGVVYFLFGGSGGVVFVTVLLLAPLFFSFLSTLLAAVVGFFLAALQSRTEGKALLTNLIYLVFLGLTLVLAFRLNMAVSDIVAHSDEVNGVLGTWLLPFGLFYQALSGDFPAFLGLAAITLFPFLLAVWLFSRFYKTILTGLVSHASRSDYRLGELTAGTAFSALFRKEAGRFFSTPIYLFNMGIGAMLGVGGSVFLCFQRDTIAALLPQIGIPAVLLAGGALGLVLLMTIPACVSISLEGKYLWILKEAPISGRTLFLAKAALNAMLIWVTGLLSTGLLWFGLALSPVEAAALLCLCGALGVFVPSFGLAVNLLFPKMDAVSDMLVVKQSLSSMVGLFSGMLLVPLLGLAYWGLQGLLGAELFLFAAAAMLLVLGLLLWSWVVRKGPGILRQL